MLDKLGQDYPYKRERSAPGFAKLRHNSSTFNIITCQDKPFTTKGGNRDSLPSIFPDSKLTRPRKLGDYVDFPNPKNKKNQEALIDYNLASKKNELLTSQVRTSTDLKASLLSQSQSQPGFGIAPIINSTSSKNLMNSSSVGYNFISNTQLSAPKTIHELRNDSLCIANRTKQIGQIYDKGRLFAPNFSQEYQTFFNQNDHPFNRNKGMCADTYNRAHTYGPGLKPFRKFK